jgi:hypothetical protein
MKYLTFLFILLFTSCTPYANVGLDIPIGKVGHSDINVGVSGDGKINLDLGGGVRISR